MAYIVFVSFGSVCGSSCPLLALPWSVMNLRGWHEGGREQEVAATKHHVREGAGAGAGHQVESEGDSSAPTTPEGWSKRWHNGVQA
jgi:hypothetical protein